jgi:hypothetical protein
MGVRGTISANRTACRNTLVLGWSRLKFRSIQAGKTAMASKKDEKTGQVALSGLLD